MQFKNPVLNQIAQDCGLVIDFSNPKATMREIEFFADKVLELATKGSDGWIFTNGLRPNISGNIRIQVMFRDLSTLRGTENHWMFRWYHVNKYDDIIAYRILED